MKNKQGRESERESLITEREGQSERGTKTDRGKEKRRERENERLQSDGELSEEIQTCQMFSQHTTLQKEKKMT